MSDQERVHTVEETPPSLRSGHDGPFPAGQIGDFKIHDGGLWRLYERELEGDKWERLRDVDHGSWEVEIRIEGESVLTIGHTHLAGIEDIDRYADAVRTCAEHLLSFIGSGESEPCFLCGSTTEEGCTGECRTFFPEDHGVDDGAASRHEG
jgi:hypothetical protein